MMPTTHQRGLSSGSGVGRPSRATSESNDGCMARKMGSPRPCATAKRPVILRFERSFEPSGDRVPTWDHRKEQLLATAARVFAETGFAGTSMRDLSKASAMSLAGIYYYCRG